MTKITSKPGPVCIFKRSVGGKRRVEIHRCHDGTFTAAAYDGKGAVGFARQEMGVYGFGDQRIPTWAQRALGGLL